jgi:hypothetical protein
VDICGDLNVIALLVGLQLGYTKYCCFLCEWDSRDRKNHYIQKQSPKRDSLIPGKKYVLNNSLVNPEKVFLPPLHIKLGLMKISSRLWIKMAQDLCIRDLNFRG